jgi:hypothetical protein
MLAPPQNRRNRQTLPLGSLQNDSGRETFVLERLLLGRIVVVRCGSPRDISGYAPLNRPRNLDTPNCPIYYRWGGFGFLFRREAGRRCARLGQLAAVGSMTIIFQIVAALVVLLFIFLTYMNTKTWRWVHVTCTFLVFVASFTFCVYAAMTLKTRAKWVKEHDNLEKQLATTEAELLRVTRGDPNDVESKTQSVLSLREELARTVLDRGRVWRNCIPNIDRRTGVIAVFTSPPADPNNPAPGPAKKNNITAKTILHAFREGQKGPENPWVPAAYIGEFKTVAVTDNSVTLEPTMPLTPEQQAVGSVPGPWVLYEVCPVDGHEWIAGDEKQRTEPLADAAGAGGLPAPLFPKLVQPYLRDGGPAEANDPPENIWYEVRFEMEHEVAVDAPLVNSIDAEPFNSEGQAVLQRLRRGATPAEAGKVMFGPKEGQIQTAILDQQTAEGLIQQGICKLEKKVFRRKLTDYERKFRGIHERIAELSGRIRQLDLDNKAMLATTAKAEQQQALVEDLKGKVTADLAKVNYELTELTKYKIALNDRLVAVQTELSQLYLSNKAIGRELARLTAELTEQIDRRTREATALRP